MKVWLGAFVAVALLLAVVAMRSRSRGGATSCPSCGGPTRLHEPYVMCDSCQSSIGIIVNNKIYLSR
jgi:hypothetical protein